MACAFCGDDEEKNVLVGGKCCWNGFYVMCGVRFNLILIIAKWLVRVDVSLVYHPTGNRYLPERSGLG